MEMALAEAQVAATAGDVPVGAVVVSADGGRVLARAHNAREVLGDPTAHAELLAVREAARAVGHWRLDGAVMYVTLEPCAMCAGALVLARVSGLVYGAADPKAGAVESLYQIATDARLNHRLAVTGGVCAEESRMLLQEFFSARRAPKAGR